MNGYNFTDRSRTILQMAREEATRLHHEYVGTEHILLALIREGEGVAAAVLTNLNVDLEVVQQKIEETVKKGRTVIARTDLPYTSRAKKVLELAMSEARELNHSYVGTEHLLLGLLREEKGIAAQVLEDVGVSLEQARAETLRLLGSEMPTSVPVHGFHQGMNLPGFKAALLDHWFRTAIALIELHQKRFGHYPEVLQDLLPHMGPFEIPLLKSVLYEKLADGYALDVVTTNTEELALNYPPQFWRGLGIHRTNVEGFKNA